ncbi:cation diffusion facilitator family transporter [Desulfovibrio sp. OttesenSCG-928-M14]|nr:cation diffusion facilitator family transporter [Desulfovibrio sp. OttesenSCG-928-M14]
MEHKQRMAERDYARGGEIRRVTLIGFILNLFLGCFKIAAGYYGDSRAVMADGVHSLSDLVTDIAVLVGVRFWMAPPDENHPYGYKRLEALISFVIGAILAVAGVGIAWDALGRLGGEAPPAVGSPLALFAATISIISKEILFRWTRAKARSVKSDALEANAWHHRSDAFSSIPVFVAVLVAMLVPSLAFVDLVGALVVAVFILHAAWQICAGASHVLVDGGSDAEVNVRIVEYVLGLEAVRDVHDLRTRYMGQGLQVDMHVCVDADLSVREGNAIAHSVEDALYTTEAATFIGLEVIDAVIHIDPWLAHEENVR